MYQNEIGSLCFNMKFWIKNLACVKAHMVCAPLVDQLHRIISRDIGAAHQVFSGVGELRMAPEVPGPPRPLC